MYVQLKGHIEILRQDGKKLSFDAFNYVECEHDIFKINSSAIVRIPTSARLTLKGEKATESVQTAKQFSRGDKIKIQLGYGNDLRDEFEGFIYRINYKRPLEIECEGYEFLLRAPITTKTWKNTTLLDVLKYLTEGLDIVLNDNVPDMGFDKFIIPANINRLEALQQLKEIYGITIFFQKNELYAGLAYAIDNGTVKYEIGTNTINDDKLKYRNADDVSLKIKAVWIKPDNTKIEAEVGDPQGSQRTLFFYNLSSLDELKKRAEEEMVKYKYSGYEGQITTFLQPYAGIGMKAELSDPQYDERKGTYYISKTKVTAGRSGGRRIIDITIKL